MWRRFPRDFIIPFNYIFFAITQHLKSIEKQWWWWDICNIHRMDIRERGDTLHIQNPNNFNTQSNWILILLQVSLSLSIASSVRSSSARSKFSMFLNSLEHIVCGMLMAMTKNKYAIQLRNIIIVAARRRNFCVIFDKLWYFCRSSFRTM